MELCISDRIRMGYDSYLILFFSVNVIVRRVGGAYGGKITRPGQIACAAAIVAHLQGKTCRFVLPLQTMMKVVGKRLPTKSNFEVSNL